MCPPEKVLDSARRFVVQVVQLKSYANAMSHQSGAFVLGLAR